MKKITTTFLLVIGLCLVLAGAASAENATEISTPEDLYEIKDNPQGDYILTADIDMSGFEWVPVTFDGKLDGQGYKISNLCIACPGEETERTIDGNFLAYESVFAGLFSTTHQASIANLRIENAYIRPECTESIFCGILAGYADRTTIENCSISGEVYLVGREKMVGISGVIGYGSCKISDCTVDTQLIFVDEYSDGKCEQFMGGVISCGRANVQNCDVTVDGYISCSGYVHSGGICGMFSQSYMYSTEGDVISNNIISGKITFYENNKDRRAYCRAVCGEIITQPSISGNTDNFIRDEIFEYDSILLPEEEKVKPAQQTEPAKTDSSVSENMQESVADVTSDIQTISDGQPAAENEAPAQEPLSESSMIDKIVRFIKLLFSRGKTI